MKGEDSIKEEGDNEKKDREIQRETLQQSENKLVIKLKRNIQELISSDRVEDDFLQLKSTYLSVLVI